MAAFLVALAALVVVTDAPAYMGSDPNTCSNCHVMDAAYQNWYHAGHAHAEVVCVDCHLPHQNVFAYYLEKARSGMHDVFVFSTGRTPELIRASLETKVIIQANCVRCHEGTVADILAGPQAFERNCWDCHRTVAHGERGISIAPRH
jgi:cytochrome c nitrite reductase small subunit